MADDVDTVAFALTDSGSSNISSSSSGTGLTFFVGGEGDDTVNVESGDVVVWGAGGNDTIYGSNSNDYLYGGVGNDTLVGGGGIDVLHGGASDAPGGVLDGLDTADYSQTTGDFEVGYNADGRVHVTGTIDGVATDDTLISVERLVASTQGGRLVLKNNVSGDIIEIVGNYAQAPSGPQAPQSPTSTPGFFTIDASALSATGVDLRLDQSNSGTLYSYNGSLYTITFTNVKARFEGTEGNDTVIFENAIFDGDGDTQRTYIDGGGGEDTLSVRGGYGAIVDGGAGNDLIQNRSFGGQLFGGLGDDVFDWAADTLIADGEGGDRAVLAGVELTGGISRGEEAVWAPQSGFAWARFGFNVAGELVINYLGGEQYVADVDVGPGAVENTLGLFIGNLDFDYYTLFNVPDSLEATPLGEVLDALLKASSFLPADDPLALDLDGDGLETTGEHTSRTYFDIDGDGFAEKTGWLGADDGWLVRDLNGNGTIDDVGELFGGPDQSGFAELSTLDENADGVVDAADSGFASLRIWRDLNQDGISQANEIETLAFHDIVSLDAVGTALGTETSTGHTLAAGGGFTRGDGTTGTSYDLILDASQLNTRYLGDTGVADWAGALPNVKGYGLLTNLGVAASRDMAIADSLE